MYAPLLRAILYAFPAVKEVPVSFSVPYPLSVSYWNVLIAETDGAEPRFPLPYLIVPDIVAVGDDFFGEHFNGKYIYVVSAASAYPMDKALEDGEVILSK